MKKESGMNYIVLGFLLLIFIFPIMQAQEETQPEVSAGTTPDSIFWGLDKAFEQISLALTSGDVDKAKKGLEIAQERLAEIKVMVEENKIEAVAKAEDEHSKIILKVKQNINEIEEDDPVEEIREEIELEQEIEEHDDEIDRINTELKVKIRIEGTLTEEQQTRLTEFLNSLEDNVREVKIEIKNKKDETKIKIITKTGKTEKEVDDEIEDIEMELGDLEDRLKVRAEIIGADSEVKVEQKFETTTTNQQDLINEIIGKFSLDRETADGLLKIETEDDENETIEDKLKVKVKVEKGLAEVEIKLKFKLGAIDRDLILDAIVERTQLTADQINGVWKFEAEGEDEEEMEIEVEIEDGIAEVEVKVDGSEWEFELEETDLSVIVNEISERTGLSTEEINRVMKVKIENGGNGDDDENDQEDLLECTQDNDCAEGEACSVNGKCEKVEEPECIVNADCGDEDKVCLEGKCEKKQAGNVSNNSG